MIQFGTNPCRFIGATYSPAMYALRHNGPLLTIHLVWLVVWLRLPWRHVSPKEIGKADDSVGFIYSFRSSYRRVWRQTYLAGRTPE